MKTAIFLVLKVIALTVILFICYAVAGGVISPPENSNTPQQAGQAAQALLAVCFLQTVILTYLILRSRWTGWKLMAAVFLVFYGVTTFMAQIESAVFITHLPPGMLPRLFLMGILVSVPFSILAVLILGKRKAGPADSDFNPRLMMPAGAWVWKLAVISFSYLILYFGFGYFIAWQNPVLREYYGGVDEGGFFVHMGAVLKNDLWLIPFQILRALLWTAIALPVIRMMKGGRLETGLLLGVLFGPLMTALLLLPNPYMPETVRLTHLLETAPSNFIFGFLIGWLLTDE